MRTRVILPLLLIALPALSEDHFTVHMGEPWNNRSIEVRGSVQFANDDRDVKAVSPGGFVRVREGRWTERKRSYEVRADSRGSLSRTYVVGGQSHAIDSEARAWIASTMLSLIRQTGIGAPERVQRILAKGGATAVLTEIAAIDSDGTKRVYVAQLISKGRLNEVELRDALRAARKISSDGDKAAVLIEVAPYCLRSGVRESWFGAASSIGSDGDRHNVLKHAVTRDGANPETLVLASRSAAGIGSDGDKADVLSEIARVYRPEARQAFFRAVSTIGSDGDRRQVLQTVLRLAGADREALAEAMRCAREIGSDGDKAAVLAEAARFDMSAESVQRAFLAAADSIGSDGDHAAVLTAALQRQSGPVSLLAGMADSAKRIGSDGDKAAVLGRLSETRIEGAEAWQSFFAAVNSIGSDGDRAAVLTRLLKRPGLHAAAVVGAVESAAGVGSDGDKASVLVLAAQTYGSDPSIRAAVENAMRSVHSDGDFRRVSSALAQRR